MPNPEEYRRTRRIVDLLLRIANQPRRWTRRRLAEHYEVSEKQIDKDLSLIRHGLRMPLRRCMEGYFFERLGAIPALTLTLQEALSLLLAARLGQQMPGVSRTDLAAAIARLESLLPAELQPLVSGLGRGDGDGGPGSPTLLEIQMAIAERSRLRLLYRSASGDPAGGAGAGGGSPVPPGDGEGPAPGVRPGAGAGGEVRVQAATERLVDPYTLLPHLRSWYLVGYCHRRGEVRMFKVDRIQAMARTGEHFEYPEEFDLAGYMGRTWGILRGEAGEPEDVVLEFAPEAGRWMRDQELHESQRVDDLPDGRVRMSFHVGITPELRRWVLGFGRQVRVIRPPHLAEWVREEARAAWELGERPSPPPGERPSPACTSSVGEPLAERGKRGGAG